MQRFNGLKDAQRSIVEDIREISQRSGQYHDSEKIASQQADIDNLWGHIQYIQHAVSEFRAWQEEELEKATSSFETGVIDGKDASTLKKLETSKKQVALDKATVDEMIRKGISSAEENIYDTMWNYEASSKSLDEYVEGVTETALTKLGDEIKALRTEMEDITEARISKIEEKFNKTSKGIKE